MSARPESGSVAAAAQGGVAPGRAGRALYWSLRRELWENRVVYLAPAAVASLTLIAYAVSVVGLPARVREAATLEPAEQYAVILGPYDWAAIVLILTSFLVAAYYCLDALHGERRDRSILFWKSLPVSDRTTVVAKASVPLVILPLLTFVVVVATQLVMLALSSAVLLASGLGAVTWERLPLLEHSLILFYGLVTAAAWHAPIYAWLLLVSGAARRAVLVWAIAPPLTIAIVETMVLGTTRVREFLLYRVGGGFTEAFVFGPDGAVETLDQLTPARFLATPGLWIGLAFAAVTLTAAAWMRRRAAPI